VSTPEERIGRLLDDMQQLLDKTVESYLGMARAGGASVHREQRIEKQGEKRDKLALRLGLEVYKLVAAGATIEVSYPVDPDDPRGHKAALLKLLKEARRRIGPAFPPATGARAEQQVLSEAVARIGKPKALQTMRDYREAVERLEAAVQHIDGWLLLPRGTQQMLMGLHSSIGQMIQQGPLEVSDRLRPTFSVLVTWSRENRPGYVSGLSRHNDPEEGTWLNTAQKWWVRLETELKGLPGTSRSDLEEIRTALQQGVGPDDLDELVKRVRRLVDDHDLEREISVLLLNTMTPHRTLLEGQPGMDLFCEVMEEQAKEDDGVLAVADAEYELPDEAVLDLTRGETMVVVGGDAPPGAPDRIEAAFELGEVRWLGAGTAELPHLVSDITAGEVGIVLLVRPHASRREIDALVPLVGTHDVRMRVVDDVGLRTLYDVLSE